MLKSHSLKFFGAILIYASTSIGAGMLALPLVTYSLGFVMTTILFLFAWAVMTLSGLLLLEVNCRCDKNTDFHRMSLLTLGPIGKWATLIVYLLLLYSLISAHIIGGSSLFNHLSTLLFNGKYNWINELIYTTFFGFLVFLGIGFIDKLNRFLLLTTIATFIFSVVLMLNSSQTTSAPPVTFTVNHLLIAAPIIIMAFGSHLIIPSLREYVGGTGKSLQWIIILGACIPLIIYLIWVFAVLASVPAHLFLQLSPQANVDNMLAIIDQAIQSISLNASLNTFAYLALTISFFGISLSMVHFYRDIFKFKQFTIKRRATTCLLTFIPAYLFLVLTAHGFVAILDYAGCLAGFLVLILPALMAYRARTSKHLMLQHSHYQVFGGHFLLLVVGFVGLFVFITGLVFA